MNNMNDTPDMTVTVTCIAAPLQMEGKIGDTDIIWYYRGRHGRWRVECPRGTEIAHGTSDTEQDIPEAMRRVIEAIWHPFLCDRYNAREDAAHDNALRFYGG